ncbi:MAG: hypothetical protein R6X25_01925 [Candidatus Krumholzibacteriia bacterium]
MVAPDVLEHVALGERIFFLESLLRVARRRLVLSFPGPAAPALERRLRAAAPGRFREHRAGVLPPPRWVEEQFAARGVRFRRLGNHQAASWLLANLLEQIAMPVPTRQRLREHLQEGGFPHEATGATYRCIYVADLQRPGR